METELFAELRGLADRCAISTHRPTRLVGACLKSIVAAVYIHEVDAIAEVIFPVTLELNQRLRAEEMASRN